MRASDRVKAAARLAALGAAYAAVGVWVGLEWLGLDARLRVKRIVMPASGVTPAAMIHGTGPKPFVLRTLVPSTVRLVREAIPDSTARRWWLKILRRHPRLVAELPFLEWEEQFLLEYLIAVVVMAVCLVGYLVAMRALYGALHPGAGWQRRLLPLAALACLPFFFARGTHFLYDFATLMFMALGLLLIERRRFGPYYAVMVLALLNKETAVLLVLVFAVRLWHQLPTRVLLAHLAAQVTLAVAVRAVLLVVFRNNPGAPAQWALPKNLLLMADRGIDLPTLGLFAVLLLAVSTRWRHEPALLKAALVMLPPLCLAYVLFGVYGEIRIFYEVVPAGVVWAFNAGLALIGAAPSAAPRPLPPPEEEPSAPPLGA
jgi:hypothetical protein